MTYLLLAVSSLAPDYAIGVSEIIMLAVIGIGVPVLVPTTTGIIAGGMIRGSDWFAGLGVGFLAGLAAIGLSILLLWIGYELFDLAGLEVIYLGVSTVVCSAVTVGILWLFRDRR